MYLEKIKAKGWQTSNALTQSQRLPKTELAASLIANEQKTFKALRQSLLLYLSCVDCGKKGQRQKEIN